MVSIYIVAKHTSGQWGVLDTRARVWYGLGNGRSWCGKKAADLNREHHLNDQPMKEEN